MDAEAVYFNIFLSCGIVHLVFTAVMALFARHKVKYLAIAWIMGIFAFALFLLTPYAATAQAHSGILHPAMLIALIVISYLQSIYPLSIPLPGYLQWGRMWYYALPALLVIGVYCAGLLLGAKPVIVEDFSSIATHIFYPDLLLRIGMLLTSFYYIINIFRLPRRLSHVKYPRYLWGYSSLLGASAVFYLVIALNYQPYLMMVYAIVFTLLNSYLCMRILETMAFELPRPVMNEMRIKPNDDEIQKSENDFNEANLQRFQRVEYWMQQNAEAWTNPTFNRDVLCREVGINRQLLLQSVRSQGYNNLHEYISSYRIMALERRIRENRLTSITLNDCLEVGFSTMKTTRSTFLRIKGVAIEDFFQNNYPAE